jgi:hypothetical protein
MSRRNPDSFLGLIERIGALSVAIISSDLRVTKRGLANLKSLQNERADLLKQLRRDYPDQDPLAPLKRGPKGPRKVGP